MKKSYVTDLIDTEYARRSTNEATKELQEGNNYKGKDTPLNKAEKPGSGKKILEGAANAAIGAGAGASAGISIAQFRVRKWRNRLLELELEKRSKGPLSNTKEEEIKSLKKRIKRANKIFTAVGAVAGAAAGGYVSRYYSAMESLDKMYSRRGVGSQFRRTAGGAYGGNALGKAISPTITRIWDKRIKELEEEMAKKKALSKTKSKELDSLRRRRHKALQATNTTSTALGAYMGSKKI